MQDMQDATVTEILSPRRPKSRHPKPAARASERLVIVGNGIAGFKLIERLVATQAARRYQITVFGEEPTPAYDRVRLTQILAGQKAEDLLLAPKEWYRAHSIDLFTGEPVVHIDRARQRLRSATGREVAYDRLVLATGSRAFVPPIPGSNLPGVFVYRTLEDLAAIREYALFCRRAAVVGGGLLGLEAAHALSRLWLETWVLERGIGLLSKQLNPEAARLLQAQVESTGLHVCTGRDTERIEAIGPERLLQFSTGECLRVHLVVLAAGVRPRDELAADCGLKLGPRGGVAVDDFLRTSDPNIFAVGECASHRNTIYGLAGPVARMAEALAAGLGGRPSPFTGADQSTSLKLPGLNVSVLGDYQANGETLTCRLPGGYRQVVLENNRLAGAIAVGRWPEESRAQEAIERRRRLWKWQRDRFVRYGRLWAETTPLPVRDWPANSIVCSCKRVRLGVLKSACSSGCATVEELACATGASTVCGSCKPLLAELVGAPAEIVAQPGRLPLFVACLLAAAAMLAIAFLGPIALSGTVQTDWSIDVLWRSSTARQITGYTAVAVILASLLFSARKRIVRFRWGEVGRWRALHAILGCAAVMAIVAHTGLRLGHNLNFVLMMNFLAAALFGVLSGGMIALDNRLKGPAARWVRAVWTGTHIALVWPFPVILLFHILSAYWF